jgi:hypothetical protein
MVNKTGSGGYENFAEIMFMYFAADTDGGKKG